MAAFVHPALTGSALVILFAALHAFHVQRGPGRKRRVAVKLALILVLLGWPGRAWTRRHCPHHRSGGGDFRRIDGLGFVQLLRLECGGLHCE